MIIARHLLSRGFEKVSRKEFHCLLDRTMAGDLRRNRSHFSHTHALDPWSEVLIYRKGILFFIKTWCDISEAFEDRDVKPLTYFAELWKFPHLLISQMPKEQMWRVLNKACEGVSFKEIMTYETEWVRRQCNGIEKIYKVGNYEKPFTSVEEWSDYVQKN